VEVLAESDDRKHKQPSLQYGNRVQIALYCQLDKNGHRHTDPTTREHDARGGAKADTTPPPPVVRIENRMIVRCRKMMVTVDVGVAIFHRSTVSILARLMLALLKAQCGVVASK